MTDIKINFITPLICPNCKWESSFGAEIHGPLNWKDGCPVCYLADWYKHKPPSSRCQKCNTEMGWTGNMMVSPEVRDLCRKGNLCEHHKDF